MDLQEPIKRPTRESVVPMINVVFLLLIFFLMTATIAPPEPFEVELPISATEDPSEVDQAVYVGADGRLSWGDLSGDAIFQGLASADIGGVDEPVLIVRADRRVPGVEIAKLLKSLAGIGIVNAQLVAEAAP
ncbi:MAG: biopolymer transporter ExbD [Pseudomonadota bacterium]